MDLVLVGKVLKPQGIKGELKVGSASFSLFKKDLKVYIDSKEFLIEETKTLSNGIIIKFDSIKTREDAEKFRNKDIYMDRSLISLSNGEYLASDVVGLSVVSKDGKTFGIVESIDNYGSADVYLVKGDKNFTFPAIRTVILSYDIENKKLLVDENRLMEVALYED